MPISLVGLIPEFYRNHLLFIDHQIKKSGHECFLVGGSVRDLYMQKTPKEYDLTTSAKPEIIKSLFKTVIETGIKHGTVTVVMDKIPYEVTTYRIDKDYSDGRHPDSVEFGSSLSEDLRRRDFTMNALALDLTTGAILDEQNGCIDIDQKIIRTIGDPIKRFSEDGLRPIRAMRFASVLNFEIDKNTRDAISLTKNITAKISVERLQDEILKSFLGDSPSIMLRLLTEENTLSLFIPDFQTNLSASLHEEWLSTFDLLPKENLGFLLGLWAYILSPALTPASWENRFKKLKFSNSMMNDALYLYSVLQSSHAIPKKPDPYELRKLILAPLKKHIQIRKIPEEQVWNCLSPLHFSWHADAKALWEMNPPLLLTDVAIKGTDIEATFPSFPKQKYGELLNFLLDLVWKVPENNQSAYLLDKSDYFINSLQLS